MKRPVTMTGEAGLFTSSDTCRSLCEAAAVSQVLTTHSLAAVWADLASCAMQAGGQGWGLVPP